MIIHDIESRSPCLLDECGGWEYSVDPATEILCHVFKIPGLSKMVLWMPSSYGLSRETLSTLSSKYLVEVGERPPKPIKDAIEGGVPFVAHNAEFEYAMWKNIHTKRYGWPELRVEQCVDTMGITARCGLPLSLDGAAEALGIGGKDLGGSAIMKQMCKPRKSGKHAGEYIYSEEKHVRLIDYCAQDLNVTEGLIEILPVLSPKEQHNWETTVRINERGINVDRNVISKIVDAEEMNIREVGLTLGLETDWEVTQDDMKRVKFLTEWMAERGVHTSSLAAGNVSDLLARKDLPNDVRAVLKARQQLAKSATAKFKRMLDASQHDGRVRGCFVYYGATKTGRFAGRQVQPHNIARPIMSQGDIDKTMLVLESGSRSEVRDTFNNQTKKGKPLTPAQVMGSLVRAVLCAVHGKTLMAADYAAIEARGVFWLSGCKRGIKIFKDFDSGVGPEPYIVMAQDIYNCSAEDVDSSMRALGKTTILGCVAENTPVLTDKGWVSIQDVTIDHKVFDGDEFVRHEGLLDKGEKEIVGVLPLTSDHKVWVEDKWVENEKLSFQELALAIHSGNCGWKRYNAGERGVSKISYANVCVEKLIHSIRGICCPGEQKGAERAVRSKAEKRRAFTATLCQTEISVMHGLIGFALYTLAAKTAKTDHSMSTAVEEYLSGLKTAESSWNTSQRSVIGMTCLWNWIGSTMTEAMSQEICGWLQESGNSAIHAELSKLFTEENECHWSIYIKAIRDGRLSINVFTDWLRMVLTSNRLSRGHQKTYDLLNAGPRHRFVIDAKGLPIIVSNCGYGMGGSKFEATCESYGIELPEPPEDFMFYYDEKYEQDKEQGKDPVYAPKGTYIVDKYRSSFPEVRNYWKEVGKAAEMAVRHPGEVTKAPSVAFKVIERKGRKILACLLPSGRALWYQDPVIKTVDGKFGKQDVVHYKCMAQMGNGGRKYMEIHTIGSHLVENICQATCRDLLCHSIDRVVEEGYDPIMHVHDELVVEVPDTYGPEDLERYEKLVAETPSWAKGFPVLAKGWIGKRYRKD